MAEVLSKTNAFSGSVDCQRRLRCRSSRLIRSTRSSLLVRDGWRPRDSSLLSNTFRGLKLAVEQNQGSGVPSSTKPESSNPKMALTLGKVNKWWEKGLQPNMKEITSAQDLVDSLRNAGDNLVVVDFFSPGCGGCKALHPKICQIAGMNSEVQFLHVNYEAHKSMCYSLGVHVLPFFRFYRGSAGRVCSFSCTNATIKKFKDALAKHSTDRCSLGPPKGLEEKELQALAANRDLGFSYVPKPMDPAEAVPTEKQEIVADSPKTGTPILEEVGPSSSSPLPLPVPISKDRSSSEEKTLVAPSGR